MVVMNNPDWSIQQRIRMDERYQVADAYDKK